MGTILQIKHTTLMSRIRKREFSSSLFASLLALASILT